MNESHSNDFFMFVLLSSLKHNYYTDCFLIIIYYYKVII